MKPQLLKFPAKATHSFHLREDHVLNHIKWHYHPEVELIHFHKGSGTQFIGNHIKRFGPGDIVLVGANLPHYWRFDEMQSSAREKNIPYNTVIHFTENFLGDRFLNIPETAMVKGMLETAKLGIWVEAQHAPHIAAMIEQMKHADGLQRLLILINCLDAFARLENVTTLSSLGFRLDIAEQENDRINDIYEYAFKHFKDNVYLDDIASVAGLTPNSFCRYFKKLTGKTFSGFLTEIRIGYACKLLIENRLGIKQVCYESGFNNFTCFHKNFKHSTGKTPQEYQREYSLQKK